jgi:hypothetical protein
MAVPSFGTAHHCVLQIGIRPMTLQKVSNTGRLAALGSNTWLDVPFKAMLLEHFGNTEIAIPKCRQ